MCKRLLCAYWQKFRCFVPCSIEFRLLSHSITSITSAHISLFLHFFLCSRINSRIIHFLGLVTKRLKNAKRQSTPQPSKQTQQQQQQPNHQHSASAINASHSLRARHRSSNYRDSSLSPCSSDVIMSHSLNASSGSLSSVSLSDRSESTDCVEYIADVPFAGKIITTSVLLFWFLLCRLFLFIQKVDSPVLNSVWKKAKLCALFVCAIHCLVFSIQAPLIPFCQCYV